MYTHRFRTKLGWVTLEGDGKSLSRVFFNQNPGEKALNANDLFAEAEKQIKSYINGKLFKFDLPLSAKGTDFQTRVWAAIAEIPYGTTTAYSSIANNIGSPKAARAVGTAANKNPFLIVIPCHRIIGSSGNLVGYAAGIETKKKLLEHELKTLHNEGKNL